MGFSEIERRSSLANDKVNDMARLVFDMPNEAFASLQKDPVEFTRAMRIAAAVKWYELELVSQGRAAEIAGLTRAEFITALGQYKVSPCGLNAWWSMPRR